jgi:hypothetical protein
MESEDPNSQQHGTYIFGQVYSICHTPHRTKVLCYTYCFNKKFYYICFLKVKDAYEVF